MNEKDFYFETFRDFVESYLLKKGSQIALTMYNRSGVLFEYSYEKIAADAKRLAVSLGNAKLAGAHIAIASENSYEWIIAFFAIAISGGVAVCIDIDNNDSVVVDMIKHADCKAVILSRDFYAILQNIESINDQELLMIVTGIENDSAEIAKNNTVSYQDFIDNNCNGNFKLEDVKLEPTQSVSIVYTSGTTSTAKPVLLSHRGILWNAADTMRIISLNKRVFNTLPLSHAYGFTAGLISCLLLSQNICLNCDLKRMNRDIALFKPDSMIAVPLIVENINKMIALIISLSKHKKEVDKYTKYSKYFKFFSKKGQTLVKKILIGTEFENLECIISGGAHLSEEIEISLMNYGVTICQGYGITECSPIVSCQGKLNYGIGNTGKLLHGFDIVFDDGEILLKGYSLMVGYYKNKELTAEAYKNGYFCTGDLGYIDKKGMLRITGRKKNLVVMKNGKKISTEILENNLMKHPAIKNAVVYGAISGSATDDVKIAASIFPDEKITGGMQSYEVLAMFQKYVDDLNKKMPIFQQIQMIDIRERDFDRTSLSKIKRNL